MIDRLISPRRSRSLAVLFAVTSALSAWCTLALAGPAAALPSNCSQPSGSTTVTCTYAGAGTYTFTVPAGVSSLGVTAVGAAGGAGAGAPPGFDVVGGFGASAEDKAVPVSQGNLSVIVGGVGGVGVTDIGGAGGSPGGGAAGGATSAVTSGGGGGGGGYSGLLVSTTPLVIAAGGGGGGYDNDVPPPGSTAGGNGDTGTGGGNGAPPISNCGGGDGCGGGGGTSMGGGTAGASGGGSFSGSGSAGTSLAGGGGGAGISGGGGGGGGYYGGGGGGGGGDAGGGGGGGSSYGIGPGLTNEATATTPASVTITYTQPNTITVTNPGNQASTVGTAVSLQIHTTDSASGQTLTYSATGLPAGLSISSSGLISGTPTTAGTSSVTVTARDATGASGSASFTWTVNSALLTTSTTLSSSPNPALETQPVTFAATVSSASGSPTGTVAFDYGSTAITGCGSVNIVGGTATCQTSSLPVGSDQITAVYSPSSGSGFQGSSSQLTETILADTPQNLANLTLQYVEGSAKFQALPPAEQKAIVALANQLIAALGKITPQLTPAQLAKLVAAYEQGVAVLEAQGWLTAAQASTLDGLAGHVHT